MVRRMLAGLLLAGGLWGVEAAAIAGDADGDGHETPFDCDDGDDEVYPSADEACDGKDNDCDELVDEGCQDGDGDGHFAGEDCDDTDAAVHPDALEVCNGRDDDCDEAVDEVPWCTDADADGWPVAVDCDEGDPEVHPGADESCNGRDDDCDGRIDEACEGDTGEILDEPLITGGCVDGSRASAFLLPLPLVAWRRSRRRST